MSLPSLQNLDKSTWRRLPFGEIAKSIGERVDPTKTDLETYVGLEHIDAESIHIKRFGKREDVSGTKLRCYPGDVIFGRRRAYQRKAAICEFDGFCSAHSLVLRAIPEVIDPKLFPFFLHSDQFMHRAVDISVGGLSPTINWTKLKTQEFVIPPKDQQAELGELLWAADSQLQGSLALPIRLEKLYGARRELLCFGDSSNRDSVWHRSLKRDVPAASQFSRLGEHLSDIRYGTSKKSNPDNKGAQCVGIPHVLDENLKSEGAAFVELTEKEQRLIQLESNDILIVRTNGNPAYTGRSAIVPSDTDLVFASYLIRLRVKEEKFDPAFLIRYLQTQTIRRFFRRHATSSAGNYNINTEDIKGVPVPEIETSEQTKIAKELSELEENRTSACDAATDSSQLLKSLINQIF